jgi:hypothetical protein
MTRIDESADRLDSAIDSILEDAYGPVAADTDELVATARLLRRSLPRLHPGFSFEEHLAARLAVARRMEMSPAAGATATPVVTAVTPTPIRPDIEVELPQGAADAHDRRRRNLVAGGAIASGVSLALPIAGAAIVVWRRSRSSGGLL